MARNSRASFIRCARSGGPFSDLNPALSWLEPVANAVKEHRQATSPDHPLRGVESLVSELTSASLDLQRALRDAFSEATFFEIYGNLAAFYLPYEQDGEAKALPSDPRKLSYVKEAIAAIGEGGYPEALARVGFLMAHKDEPLPLSRLQLAHDLLAEYRDFLPDLPMDEARRIGGKQEIIARYEPDQAVMTLPALLRDPQDRQHLLTLPRPRARGQARAKNPAVAGADRDACTHSRGADAADHRQASGKPRQRIDEGEESPCGARGTPAQRARDMDGAPHEHRFGYPALPRCAGPAHREGAKHDDRSGSPSHRLVGEEPRRARSRDSPSSHRCVR
jgi:hypothetical protein